MALLRLISEHHRAGRSVAVFSRRRRGFHVVEANGITKTFDEFGKYGEYLSKVLKLPPGTVRFSSTHGFKGQESEAVILLSADERNYPSIHPHWFLSTMFGDTIPTITEAGRRLFYVGVSRPKVHLDIVIFGENPSPFWTDAMPAGIKATPWGNIPQVALGAAIASIVELRVYNAQVEHFDVVRSQLKASGFRYHGDEKRWWRHFDVEHFDTQIVLSSPWANEPGIRIEAWHGDATIWQHRGPERRTPTNFNSAW
ncbi:hypothetical protein GOACH_15_00360 [Gordonia aichiensis NBRC 108223]|uniref:UvrD-like helicase C-terminal domain-containing protein n=1 Tax=Gordonia aichiensis NBRC 108223 TaxID=1220583 RepID=L7KLR4_9ACTN|nr:hypothetical protein GOACH_15_00360 [Gordonia aichiensis NBRC 108223]